MEKILDQKPVRGLCILLVLILAWVIDAWMSDSVQTAIETFGRMLASMFWNLIPVLSVGLPAAIISLWSNKE